MLIFSYFVTRDALFISSYLKFLLTALLSNISHTARVPSSLESNPDMSVGEKDKVIMT